MKNTAVRESWRQLSARSFAKALNAAAHVTARRGNEHPERFVLSLGAWP